ncbi:hypothetical protein DXG03_001928 [Asterophora parasitica]|uniref:Thioredoxin domain-containing protein n=1 Tax=Asterophora parasitica TaxID=117018 RepID=A0A9P7KCI3_9AGAR|nr:hypothetical protein DXG03_001928 [Asterophora parasitica]
MSASLALRSLQRASLSAKICASSRSIHSTARRAEQYANANLETFNKVVGTKDRIVLVDFYADWCGPCRHLSPILESIATDSSIKSHSGLPVDVVKIDTENEEVIPLAQKYKVRPSFHVPEDFSSILYVFVSIECTNTYHLQVSALPTVIAFRNGEPVDQFVGALNAAGVQQFLQRL